MPVTRPALSRVSEEQDAVVTVRGVQLHERRQPVCHAAQVCKLTTLTQLILHANEDNSIPEEIGRLSMLRLLQVDGMIRLTARYVLQSN